MIALITEKGESSMVEYAAPGRWNSQTAIILVLVGFVITRIPAFHCGGNDMGVIWYHVVTVDGVAVIPPVCRGNSYYRLRRPDNGH